MKTTRRNAMKLFGAGVAAGALGMPYIARAQGQPYKLGFLTALSGPSEPLGAPMYEGVKIAVEEINKAGGVNGRPFELLVRDTKGMPDVGTVAARELIGEGANMLIGIVSSAVALGVSAILKQEDAVLITCAAHSLRLTHENFNRNYFRITDNPYMRQRAQAKLMAELHPETIAWGGLVPDHEYGRSTWDSFEHGLRQFYPEIAGKKPNISKPILTPYNSSDYRNIVASAMRDPAVGTFVSAYGGDAITLYQQAKPYGFFGKKKPIVDSVNEFIVAKAMKSEMPEMWIGSHWYSESFKGNEISDKLYKAYVEKTGEKHAGGWVAEGHAGVMAYAAALKKTGEAKTSAIIDALEGLSFESATGTRTIRKEDHQTIKPVVIYKIRSAKNADGFEVTDHKIIDGKDVIEPPTPGGPVQW